MQAAIKVHDDQAIALGGASLPPGRGVASASGQPTELSPARAFDGFTYTSWIGDAVDAEPFSLEYRFSDGVCWVVTDYTLVNGAVDANRDPKTWELQGSIDGTTWVALDSRKQEVFGGRRSTRYFRVRSRQAYNRYRLVFPADAASPRVEIGEVGLVVKAHVLPPTEVSVHGERGAIAVNWQPVESATGYTVRRATERLGEYALVASGVQGTHYEDKGPFVEGELCYYTVSAELASAQGVQSVPVSTPTPVIAPAGVTAKLGAGLVVLEWTPSPRAVAYVVRRSLNKEGPYAVIGSQITAPAYTDKGLSEGTGYYYVVCGVANGKEGVDSAPVSALFPPAAPSALTAEAGKETVVLKWNAVALAKSYKVLRASPVDGPKEEVGVTTGETTFTDAAKFGKTYHYTVVAVNDCGASVESASVASTPLRPSTWWRK